MLRLDDHWVWDSWIADDGDRYHLYFLQAPRSLAGPDRRHLAARIGHASSTDLVSWEYHGVALAPDAAGAWDDVALWTGSAVRGDDGLWRMFYTGLSSRGFGLKDQRVGVAVSQDLHIWRRPLDRPVLEADPRWYTTLSGTGGPSETWRDPFVFRDPDGDGWWMYVCARQAGTRRFDDGVVATARSHDLVHWQAGPPATAPARFGQLEVVQVRPVDGRWVMVFTCHPDEQDPLRRKEFGEFCTWTLVADHPLGPWDASRAVPFEAEPHLFAAPFVQDRDGGWNLVGFRNLDPDGPTRFEITDPVPVRLDGDRLVVR